MGLHVDVGVTTGKVAGGWLVEVSGEVDLHTAPSLRAALDGVLAEASAGDDVLVDLSAVGFMDSTGLGELVGAHKALARRDGRLHVVVGNDRVARLLSLTALDDVLEVHRDRSAALASLADGS